MRPEFMQAGLLRETITLQPPVASVDAAGQNNYTFGAGVEVRAHADQSPGKQQLAAVQTSAIALCVFTVRYRSDVDATWRVLWNGKPWAIVAPPADLFNRRQWLEIICTQGVGDGAPRHGEVLA